MSAVPFRVRMHGIEVPTSGAHTKMIIASNGFKFWASSTVKEMTNVKTAFELLPSKDKAPPGWRKASGHQIFDVKMDSTAKTRWVINIAGRDF